MGDHFRSFSDLALAHVEGRDYSRLYRSGASGILIMAPHGGGIEFKTAPLARLVAGEDHALYCFEGCRSHGNGRLHITSTNFDEPIALSAVAASDYVVAIHGAAENDEPWTMVGGLAMELRESIEDSLLEAGFRAWPRDHRRAGTDPRNICNRARHCGVQLELSAALRTAFNESPDLMQRYTAAVRAPLATLLHQPA